jgi:MFS family permease
VVLLDILMPGMDGYVVARRLAARTAGKPPLLVAVTGLAVGMGMMQPSLNSLISRRAGAEEQGQVMGLAQSVGSLARVLGPISAGALFEGFGRHSPYFWGAALVVCAILLSWRFARTSPAAATPQAPPGSRMGPAE